MAELASGLSASERFDAIVVDEGQDFGASWWPALFAAYAAVALVARRRPWWMVVLVIGWGLAYPYWRNGVLELVGFIGELCIPTEEPDHIDQVAANFPEVAGDAPVGRVGLALFEFVQKRHATPRVLPDFLLRKVKSLAPRTKYFRPRRSLRGVFS